jgi:hypothetical protein
MLPRDERIFFPQHARLPRPYKHMMLDVGRPACRYGFARKMLEKIVTAYGATGFSSLVQKDCRPA